MRGEMLSLMEPTDELCRERMLLASCPPGSPLRVPPGSATGSAAWSVYENAIRAAAVWWPHRHSGNEPLTAKGLAAKAFRKVWEQLSAQTLQL